MLNVTNLNNRTKRYKKSKIDKSINIVQGLYKMNQAIYNSHQITPEEYINNNQVLLKILSKEILFTKHQYQVIEKVIAGELSNRQLQFCLTIIQLNFN